MAADRLDVRDVSPAQRHPLIHDAFAALDPGETLEIVNDHDPKPLYYEFQAEVEAFDPDAYSCDELGPNEFLARLPKRDA